MQLQGRISSQAADALAARSVRDAEVAASSALFDETLPFPPPLHAASSLRSMAGLVPDALVPAVEIERTSRGANTQGLSLEQLTEASLARARGEEPSPNSETPARAPLVRAPASAVVPGRLQWRGRELSAEFHEYALRVSRGEQLAPFRGQLLADEGPGKAALREHASPHAPVSPWEPVGSLPLRSKGPRVLGLLLLASTLVAVITGIMGSQEEAPVWNPPAPVAVVAALAPAPPTVAEPEPSRASVEPPAAAEAPSPPPSPPRPAPAPLRQLQPRKAAAPAPVAAPAAPRVSPLLVEKAPF